MKVLPVFCFNNLLWVWQKFLIFCGGMVFVIFAKVGEYCQILLHIINMQCGQEFSFQDLKCKTVVNVLDGKILGNIVDIVFFPETGKILGFVVPGEKKSWFKPCDNIFIPYSCVCKVGVDCILVKLFVETKNPQCLPKNPYNMIGILDENKNEQNFDANPQSEQNLQKSYQNFYDEKNNY